MKSDGGDRRTGKFYTRLKWFREADKISDDLNFNVEFNIETYLIDREIETESLQKLQLELDKLTKSQREAIFLRFTQNLSSTSWQSTTAQL